MTGLRRVSVGAMALAMLAASPAFAQAQDAHSGHHPANAPAAASQPSTPPPAQPDAMKGGATGMDGHKGTMGGHGMPMKGGMMGGDMAMCRMMGGGMAPGIDARLSAIRSELGITSAQATSWDNYAAALRTVVTNMDRLHETMMGVMATAPATPIEILDRHDRMLEAARDNMNALRAPLTHLYAMLTPVQQQKANTLLAQPGLMQPMQMRPMMGQ